MSHTFVILRFRDLLGKEELSSRAASFLCLNQNADDLPQQWQRCQNTDLLLAGRVDSIFLRRDKVEKSLCSGVELMKSFERCQIGQSRLEVHRDSLRSGLVCPSLMRTPSGLKIENRNCRLLRKEISDHAIDQRCGQY